MREIPIEEFEPQFRLTLEKAQKAISGKYFHYARALLLGLLDRYPNAPQVRLMLRQVTIVIHESNTHPALAWVKTALSNLFYSLRHSPLHQINSLEKIITKTPDCLWAHRNIAHIAMNKELWQTAALSLETITTLDPAASHDKILLSRAYLKLGRIEEAQQIIKGILGKEIPKDFEEEFRKALSEKM